MHLVNIGEVAADIRRRAEGRPRVLVGIDGPGASGKSTLAAILAASLPDAQVVHVDDFYLPTKDQDSRAGHIAPHFDWPRLTEQVIGPAASGEALRYQRYDWGDDALAEWIEVPATVPVIVEGVYCLETNLRAAYTFKIVCRASREVRLRRGLDRDGEDARDTWLGEWMPAEDAYTESERPAESADLIVDSTVGASGESQFYAVR